MAAAAVDYEPQLLIAGGTVGLFLAWRAAAEAPEQDSTALISDGASEQSDEPDEPPLPLAPDEFVDLVRGLIGETRSGVLLREIAAALPGGPWETSTVRALCAAAEVPVHPSVRGPGRGSARPVSKGVRKRDLPPLPSAPSEDGPVAGSSAGQGTATGPATATPVVEEHAGGAFLIVRHGPDRRQGVERP